MALTTYPQTPKSISVGQTDYKPELQPWINQVGVVRTAEQFSRFEGRFAYGINNRFWSIAKNVNGSKLYLENQSGVELQIGTTTGDAYYDITSNIFFYQPDTVVHAATALLLQTEPNVLKFWGLASYASNEIKDGYLVRNNAGAIEFVKVSSASGTTVETILPRSSWYDPLDGTGPSGESVSFEELQMVEITHAWYGGGCAFLFFRIQGKSILAATFRGGANGLTEPIIGNPNLSIIYGIEALSTLSSPATFRHWGLSVSVDGNKQETGALFGCFVDPKSVAGGSWTPLLSIRLKSTFSIDGATPKTNTYGYITDILMSISCSSRDAIFAVIRDPVLVGASFTSIPDVNGNPILDSMVERDISATSFSSGTIIYPRAAPSNSSLELNVFLNETLNLNSLGTEIPVLSIAARPLAGGNSTVGATLSWREVY